MGFAPRYGRDLLVEWAQALAPVCVGGALYLLYRAESLRMFAWIEGTPPGEVIFQLRRQVAAWEWQPEGFVLYSLPHCLWTYSFTYTCWLIARPWRGWASALALTIGTGSGLVLEFLQAWKLIPGTFDPADLAGYLVAGGNALWIARRWEQRRPVVTQAPVEAK